MYLGLFKVAGIPLAEGLSSVQDLPHTLTQAIMYRAKLDSFNELPKEKRPPRHLWDKSHALNEFLDHIWDTKEDKGGRDYMEYNLEDVE